MKVARDVVGSCPVAISELPGGLSAIRQPDCPAILWEREPLGRFQSWIDALAPEQLPQVRTILRPGDVRRAAAGVCDLCGTPECAEREMLIDDTAALAHIFAELMQSEYVLMRLDVVTTNKCRKFHIDAVTARMICTYRGTGTQLSVPDGETEPEHIFTVPTAAPLVLRGTLWPTLTDTNLLHRSPPIAGTGETRLMLVLDPVTEPDQHPDRKLLH